jgi:hypothetical protein
MQPQQQHPALVELPASRQPVLEEQQQQEPLNEKATKVTTFDNKLAEIPQQTQKEEEEKLKQRIEELQRENKILREVTPTQGQQLQQQQEEERFTALVWLHHGINYVPIKVTVNVKTKSIEFMEVAYDAIEVLNHDNTQKL